MLLMRFIVSKTLTASKSFCSCKFKKISWSKNNLFAKTNVSKLTSWTSFSTDPHVVSQGYENSYAFGILNNVTIKRTHVVSSHIEDKLKMAASETICERTKDLVDELKKEIKTISDSELVGLLSILHICENTEIYNDLWRTIDEEGAKRVPNGEASIVLAGAIKIYEMHLFHRSEWIWSCLKRFCRRLDRLTTGEMLQVMFLVNIVRRFPQQYSGFDIQYHLVNHFENLSLDEMALVSIAFFKSQTKLSNKAIMSKVMRKLLDEAENCQSFSLAMLCKIIRYSLPVTLADELYVLQSKLVQEVPRMELKSLMHVALAGTNVLLCHEPLIRAIADRLRENLTAIRLKDMERMLFVLSLYNLRDDDFTDRVVQELSNREKEIEKFPKALVCVVNYLALFQRFEMDLLERVLSQKFIKETYNMSFRKIGNELIYIDKSVEIEKPDYKGNRLSIDMLKTSAKIMTFSENTAMTGTQRFSYEIEDVLKKLYGLDNVCYVSILPHYHFPDFVIGFNDSLNPMGPPKEWRVHRWGELKRLPDNTHIWLAIISGGWNTLIRNTGEPLGSMRAKLRQLKTLGFYPVLASHLAWRKTTDKVDYIKKLIEPELHNIKAQLSGSSK